MKNVYYLFFLCLVIVLGCKKETPPPVIPVEPTHLTDLGTIAFKKNGILVNITGNVFISQHNTFQFSADYRKILQIPSLEESFVISRIPYATGKYNLHKFPTNIININEGKPISILGWTIELDQPVGQLESTDLFLDDFIEVLEIDTIAKTVEGRFQLHLNNVDNLDLSEFNLPDSVYITEGVFYLKTE